VVYICIPARDEAETLGVLLWKIRKVMGEFERDYRVMVLDDASSDSTAEVLERYRKVLPLTVIRNEEGVGYGRGMEQLLRQVAEVASYPKRDCAVMLQADFTEDPEDMVSLVKLLEGGADIVAGCMDRKSDAVPRNRWAARLLAPVAMRRVRKRLTVSDPLSGLRAYRVVVLRKALRVRGEDRPLVTSDGWAANVELLGVLTPHARRVAELSFSPRFELQTRPSRFRAGKTLLALARLRSTSWGEAVVADAD